MLLEQKAYDFATKILSLEKVVCNPHNHCCSCHSPSKNSHSPPKKTETEKEININEINITKTKDSKRIIGSTDYSKFENLAKGYEAKEAELKKEKDSELNKYSHLMGCNNDLRKEKQLMDKPIKEKIEASKRFKTEGDDLLKQKKFDEAIVVYEKGLLQLFYTFPDDKEEDKEVERIKENINLNCSFCEIKKEKYDKATEYLNEAMRVNKENVKTLYRMSFCHFKLEKFEQAKNEINQAINICKQKGNDEKPFQDLLNDINNKVKQLQDNQDNLLKKMGKSKI